MTSANPDGSKEVSAIAMFPKGERSEPGARLSGFSVAWERVYPVSAGSKRQYCCERMLLSLDSEVRLFR